MLEKARENEVDRHLKGKVKGKAMIGAEATIETMMTNLPKMHTKVKRKEAPEAVALAKAKAKARVNPEAHLSDLVARVRVKVKAKLTAADHLLKVKARVKEVRNHVLSLPKVFVPMGTSAGTAMKVDQLKLTPPQPIPRIQNQSLRRTRRKPFMGPQLSLVALSLL